MTTPAMSFYEFGPFRMDTVKRLLLRGGKVVPLPPKAFDTLLILIENSDRVVEKSELMNAIWPDSFVEESNLTQNVSILRKALGERAAEHRYIVTIPGRGYRFVADVGQVSDPGSDVIVERHSITRVFAEREEETIGLDKAEVERSPAPEAFPERSRQTNTSPQLNRTLWLLSALVAAGLIGVVSYLLIAPKALRPESILEVKSIAVLPFKSLSAEGGDQYLGLGMADTLITRLSSIKQLIVRPTSAVRRYTDENQDPLAAGREQQVDAVLDGSIHETEGRIRVTARLINSRDGSSLWAGSFEERYEDIFRLQDSIVERLAAALTLSLTGEEQQRLTKSYTDNIEAYHAYLKGRYYWNKRSADGIRRAIEEFQQAIDRDPNYALGYVGAANSYAVLNHYDPSIRRSMFPQAREAALKALEIDDKLAEAHSVLAVVKYNYEWDWEGAERSFKRALDLNPNDETVRQWYAECLLYQGRIDEGIIEIERAYGLAPVSIIINTQRAAAYLWRGQTDQAIEHYQKTLDLEPNLGIARYGLGMCYVQQGRHDEAIATYRESSTQNGLAALGFVYGVSGRRSEARAALKQLDEMYKQQYVSPYYFAIVHSGLGEADEALRFLESAYKNRDARLVMLKVDQHFDGLRSDPRFEAILRRIRLAS